MPPSLWQDLKASAHARNFWLAFAAVLVIAVAGSALAVKHFGQGTPRTYAAPPKEVVQQKPKPQKPVTNNQPVVVAPKPQNQPVETTKPEPKPKKEDDTDVGDPRPPNDPVRDAVKVVEETVDDVTDNLPVPTL